MYRSLAGSAGSAGSAAAADRNSRSSSDTHFVGYQRCSKKTSHWEQTSKRQSETETAVVEPGFAATELEAGKLMGTRHTVAVNAAIAVQTVRTPSVPELAHLVGHPGQHIDCRTGCKDSLTGRPADQTALAMMTQLMAADWEAVVQVPVVALEELLQQENDLATPELAQLAEAKLGAQ